MKFDLFDAMAIMQKEFQGDGEILLRSTDFGLSMRLSVFRNSDFHHVEFMVSYTEIDSDEHVNIMNQKFQHSIVELKGFLPEKVAENKEETYEQQMNDSNMIFKQITCGDFTSIDEAKQALYQIYLPDMTISRAGISHVLGRLEKYYGNLSK